MQRPDRSIPSFDRFHHPGPNPSSSSAAAGGVDYSAATVVDVFGTGTAEVVRDGGTTKVVFTATGASQYAYVVLDGVVASTAGGPFEVTFTDDRSGRTTRATFEVYDDFGHGG